MQMSNGPFDTSAISDISLVKHPNYISFLAYLRLYPPR